MNFHEDVRPFKCEYCNYQSRTNSQLKVHMMRHAGKKKASQKYKFKSMLGKAKFLQP